MEFTREEFETMVQEILYTTPSKYDALCRIATVTIGPLVPGWCRQEDILRNRGLEGDLMQSILLHLIKTVVHGFLLNDRTTGAYNDNPEGFAHWLTKVAKNHKRDYVNKLRRAEGHIDRYATTENMVAPMYSSAAKREQERVLRRAFNVVMDSDVRVYKVLTWLAAVLFMVEKEMKHHKANALVVTVFENKTLREMYDFILAASKQVPWMTITPQQHARIMKALEKPYNGKGADGRTFGEMTYHECFMDDRGEKSGKKSVSDWMYRMNERVVERVDMRDTTDTESDPQNATGKKRRDEDGSSNVG